jgi:hypothetical protein
VAVPNKSTYNKGTIYPRMLVCEGVEDHYFLDALIEKHSIPKYHIIDTGGNGKIEGAISAFNIDKPKIMAQITRFVFINDNDQRPRESFSSTSAQINALFGSGAAPAKPEETSRKNGKSFTILMMPSNSECGHLERFCIPSARTANKNIAEIVDRCLAMAGAEKWLDDCIPPKRMSQGRQRRGFVLILPYVAMIRLFRLDMSLICRGMAH